ncbi:MAG: DUF5103 domain-containing protein [Bacteroidales bacterium]
MSRYIYIIILFILTVAHTVAQDNITYRTTSLDDRIHSLQVMSNRGFISPPVIELGRDDHINISFDLFGDEQEDLSYSVIHCNANWKPSLLSTLEYINGFDVQQLSDWALSFNTRRSYVNYKLQLPNSEISFKVSGNYAVVVYPQNDRKQPLLYACFSVSEDAVKIDCDANSRTDVGYTGEFQQVSFRIARRNYDIVNPTSDLKIYVMQNNRLDNMAFVSTPQYFNNNEIVYEHNRDLIFEAGNEYRRFETVNSRFKGMRVERLAYFDPYYHAILETDRPRTENSYQYDETQHGKYLIRESDYEENSDTQGDYFVVHFTLDTQGMLLPAGESKNRYVRKNSHVETRFI